jgi:hypothetical protein
LICFESITGIATKLLNGKLLNLLNFGLFCSFYVVYL